MAEPASTEARILPLLDQLLEVVAAWADPEGTVDASAPPESGGGTTDALDRGAAPDRIWTRGQDSDALIVRQPPTPDRRAPAPAAAPAADQPAAERLGSLPVLALSTPAVEEPGPASPRLLPRSPAVGRNGDSHGEPRQRVARLSSEVPDAAPANDFEVAEQTSAATATTTTGLDFARVIPLTRLDRFDLQVPTPGPNVRSGSSSQRGSQRRTSSEWRLVPGSSSRFHEREHQPALEARAHQAREEGSPSDDPFRLGRLEEDLADVLEQAARELGIDLS